MTQLEQLKLLEEKISKIISTAKPKDIIECLNNDNEYHCRLILERQNKYGQSIKR